MIKLQAMMPYVMDVKLLGSVAENVRVEEFQKRTFRMGIAFSSLIKRRTSA